MGMAAARPSMARDEGDTDGAGAWALGFATVGEDRCGEEGSRESAAARGEEVIHERAKPGRYARNDRVRPRAARAAHKREAPEPRPFPGWEGETSELCAAGSTSKADTSAPGSSLLLLSRVLLVLLRVLLRGLLPGLLLFALRPGPLVPRCVHLAWRVPLRLLAAVGLVGLEGLVVRVLDVGPLVVRMLLMRPHADAPVPWRVGPDPHDRGVRRARIMGRLREERQWVAVDLHAPTGAHSVRSTAR